MSVRGEFKRLVGSVADLLEEGHARGADACLGILRSALLEEPTDLSDPAERVLACWEDGGAATRVTFSRASERERFVESGEHLAAICRAILGRGAA